MKVCFYTAIFKGEHFSKFDIPAQFKKIKDFDYILFTNIKDYKFDTAWDIKYIDFEDINSCVIKARKIKHQGYKILKNYDYIIWCDAYWSPINNKRITELMIQESNKNSGIVMSKNPYRNCAYAECDEIVLLKKDSKTRIENTKNMFLKLNLPKNFESWRTTFICINMKKENAHKLLDALWELLKNNEFTHRDQPLLSLAIYQTKISPSCPPFLMQECFKMNGKIGKHTYE